MPAPKELDPSESLAALYGVKLRKLRLRAGLTQRQLGAKVPTAHSRIAQFERGKEVPPEDIDLRLNELLGAGGDLTDIWHHAKASEGSPYAPYARRYMELEARATKMLKYLSQVVPGILQTEAYARAQMRNGKYRDSEEQIEVWVRARVARQAILRRSSPPVFWCVLDEAVLRRPVGGPGVMADQIACLIDWTRKRHVVLQVLPFDVGAHPMMSGEMTILSFSRGPDAAYVEGSHRGELVREAGEVAELSFVYDMLQAQAASPEASLAIMARYMEEYRACAPHG